eukprot:4430584-Prorocentrum_lima.AAC.1
MSDDSCNMQRIERAEPRMPPLPIKLLKVFPKFLKCYMVPPEAGPTRSPDGTGAHAEAFDENGRASGISLR